MAISLFDAVVLSFRQTVGAVGGVLAKGRAHLEAEGVDPDSFIETRLIEDMLPFRYQIYSVVNHSVGALAGCKAGVFTPGNTLGPDSWAGLEALIAEANAALAQVTPDEVNALEGKDVMFSLGKVQMPFAAEGFLLSFSLPNLHFHATTTYALLRAKGVKLGKRDYMGVPRLKM
ncbi:MAG: DUF1993 domain-containing protein [Micropepsaceae bacterium]